MAMDHKDYKNCLVGKYHNFKVLATPYEKRLESTKQVEICTYCKEKKEYVFKENGDMVDSQQYFLDHIRAFAQPSMACYYDLHPNAPLEFAAEVKEQKRSEVFQQASSEKFKHEIKKILG